MRQRIIVCPLIENDNAFLLCKMAAHKGVFPASGHCPAAASSRVSRSNRRCGAKCAKSWAPR